MVSPDRDKPFAIGWPALAAMAAALLALALAQTDPLWRHWFDGIPYGYHVVPGYELVPLMPGDHLQFLYWCWLLVDNLFGPSAFLTNPYEFHTFLSPGLAGFANFPFSLLYVVFYPLGQAAAYNCLALASYVLAGLAAYALAAEVLEDRVAAVPAGLVFGLLPFRAAQVLSGHLYGFVAFLLPLCLFCLERGLRRRSWGWGAGAGACLVAMGWMEGHLIYYTALLLGAYVPARLLLAAETIPAAEEAPAAAGPVLMVLAAGLGAGLGAWLAAGRGDGLGEWTLGATLGLLIILALCLWLLAARLATALTSLGQGMTRRILARGLLPLALAPVYGVQLWLDVPHLGKVILALLALALAGLTLPPLWRARRLPRLAPGIWRPVLPLVLGLGLAAARMIYIKRTLFAGSIAGGGRGLDEVRLFTPHLGDLFDPSNVHMERLIPLGWILGVLGLAGLTWLALGRDRDRGAGQPALWAALAALGLLLCLGPTVTPLPLYELLYQVVPYFNFPRVPGRLVLVGMLFLALLAGWVVARLRTRLPGGRGPALALALILTLAAAWDTWPPTPTGVCLVPPPGPVEAAVRRELPPEGPGRLLCLPVWPGDSHQSSLYELMIARTRARLVNGYSPVVPRAYVEEVYRPLDALNLGLVTPEAREALARLEARVVAFYDDDLVYPRKVSPFPPALARQRLAASGVFTPQAREGNVFLWGYDADAPLRPAWRGVTSPVAALWEAEWLPRDTGRLKDDDQASGWGLMFAEASAPGGPLGPRSPRARGNRAEARAGRDPAGFLGFGPFKALPPGDYTAVFRLRRGPGPDPGFVDVTAGRGARTLARAELDTARLPADGAWHDVALDFSVEELADLEFRTWFDGRCDLDLDLVLVRFAAQESPLGFYRAQDLWRQAGDLTDDERVPGGLAVAARAGWTPPLYLIHGPQATLGPGRYQARFRLAAPAGAPAEAVLADLVVATDLGRVTLGHRRAQAADLGSEYRDLVVDFDLERRCEVGLRVRYTGRGDLRVAGVELRARTD